MAQAASVADAADPRQGRSKRPRREAYDGGTPLADELLLAIWDLCPDLADLVRFAATCRRWRGLVSGEAAFLSRTPRRLPSNALVLGFIHRHGGAAGFVPTAASAWRKRNLPGFVNGGGLLNSPSSRVVASRNGLLVVELRRGNPGVALELCVCNPVTGVEHVLPPLASNPIYGGDGSLDHYACALITTHDCSGGGGGTNAEPPRPSSYFKVMLVYTRPYDLRVFHRSYSHDDDGGGGSWSNEAELTKTKLGQRQMRSLRGGIVWANGKMVAWLAKNVVFALCLINIRNALPDAYVAAELIPTTHLA